MAPGRECDYNPFLRVTPADCTHRSGEVSVPGYDDGCVKGIVLSICKHFDRDVHVSHLFLVCLPSRSTHRASLPLGLKVAIVNAQVPQGFDGFEVRSLAKRFSRIVRARLYPSGEVAYRY